MPNPQQDAPRFKKQEPTPDDWVASTPNLIGPRNEIYALGDAVPTFEKWPEAIQKLLRRNGYVMRRRDVPPVSEITVAIPPPQPTPVSPGDTVVLDNGQQYTMPGPSQAPKSTAEQLDDTDTQPISCQRCGKSIRGYVALKQHEAQTCAERFRF